MTEEATAASERLRNTGRIGSSRKLLQRKALETAAIAPAEEALEHAFPACAEAVGGQAPEPSSGPLQSSPGAAPAAPTQVPAPPPAWSNEDEAAFQALLARRKAAGYQRRGRDVSGQRLRPGDIKPNPDTVIATIVGIVAERGEVSRAELIDAMSATSFPHPKARPQDKGWCQGWVAGALRSGFLAVALEGPGAGTESSATPTSEPSAPAVREA